MKIGFIGQGWIGKHYADDFENRGHAVIRYALETPYSDNKDEIATCDIVFIAVPTPTTKEGFDARIVERVLPLVGKGNIAVIKSTIIPGTTETLQSKFPEIFVLHSPEFLVEKTAAYDAARPNRNIIGIPVDTEEYRDKARLVLSVLPDSPFSTVMRARDAEFVKYAGNCFLFTKVVFMNLLYDLVRQSGGNWEHIREAMINDPRIGTSHTEPAHSGGRGAGGHCLIKDFEAFREMFAAHVNDNRGAAVLTALVEKNIELLVQSNKDHDLLEGVYGDLKTYKTLNNVVLE